MTTVKSKKLRTGTMKLKKLSNDQTHLSPNKYKYVVEFPDGDRVHAGFTKEDGMRAFNREASYRGAPKSSGGFLGGIL